MARMEVTYDNRKPAWAELERIAAQRGGKRQEVLELIVHEWYLLKTGQPLTAEQLWGITQHPYAAGMLAQNGTGQLDADAPHAGASYLADSLM
jgi:hypothetical protein